MSPWEYKSNCRSVFIGSIVFGQKYYLSFLFTDAFVQNVLLEEHLLKLCLKNSWKIEFHKLFGERFSFEQSYLKLSYSRFIVNSSSENKIGFYIQCMRPLLAIHFWCHLWHLCKELDIYGVLYLQIYPEFQLLDFYYLIISLIQD